MSGRATLLQFLRYKREIGGEDEGEMTSPAPPPNYDEGPHPLISGSQYNHQILQPHQPHNPRFLVLLDHLHLCLHHLPLHVLCFLLEVGCQQTNARFKGKAIIFSFKTFPLLQELPMITDMLDQVEAQSNGHEKKDAV